MMVSSPFIRRQKAATYFLQQCQSTTTRQRTTRFVPSPTWSVTDLALHQQHTPLAVEPFQILCRRACLLLEQPDDPNLRQDVGNMMHMLRQVANVTSSSSSAQPYSTVAEMYDRPRGVTAAPVLDPVADAKNASSSSSESANVDTSWLNTIRQHKMKRVGGHYYFEIETGASKT